MGLFDKLKGKKTTSNIAKESTSNIAETVSDAEKQYYAEDDYYTKTAFEGTSFERKVTTFDEWKKRSYPSGRGLYVPEVLLLHYCNWGDYPHPAKGYPGLWWFKYGIRDVTAVLKQLEDRDFICFGSVKSALNKMRVPELKELLTEKGCSASGKKADLIERISENYSDEELISKGVEPKYTLTPLGEEELQDNEYVPFMHSFKYITTEGYPDEFNVWSINRLFKGSEPDNWKDCIINEYNRTHNGTSLLDQLFRAEVEYQVKEDIDKYVAFWEELWSTKGKLDIDLPYWIFTLPELYMKTDRYDEAVELTRKIDQLYQHEYGDVADQLIQRIESQKAKANK